MKKLLEELKQIDPACYDEIWQWVLRLEEDSYAKDDPKYLKHRDDVIQGCVQMVVAANGWQSDLVGILRRDNKIYEYSYTISLGKENDKIVWSEWTDTPAKAILTAYIAARRANHAT